MLKIQEKLFKMIEKQKKIHQNRIITKKTAYIWIVPN